MGDRLLRQQSEDIQQTIEDCLDAYAIAKETISYSLQQGGDVARGELIVTLLTCSDVCRSTAEFIVIEAALRSSSCGFCAIVCDFAAEQCERFEDEQLTACAEAMRNCAQSCRELASADVTDDRRPFGYS